MNTQSTYMQWAKQRPKVTYDLGLSGILNLPFPELEATLEDIDLNGDNSYGYPPLVEALAEHRSVPKESLVTISGGTSMANHLAMAAAIEHGDEVVIEEPTYEPLMALAKYFSAKICRFTRRFENNYRVDADEVERVVTEHTRLIVLTNLHNPSSALTDESTLIRIGDVAAKVGARVLVDEVYLEAVFENAPRSAFHLGKQFIATSSLTKGYGLSGLRCGWIIAEPELAERMRLLHDIFASIAPQPTERLSVVALRNLPNIATRARNILETNRAVLTDFLDAREDLQAPPPSQGTTSFPRLMRGNVDRLSDVLHEKYDTAIVPGRFFESSQHFRIGMCAQPALFREGVKRLGRALDELSE